MDNPDPGRPRIALGAELIIPVLSVAFAIYYLISVRSLSWEAKVSALFTIVVLFALIAVLGLRYFRAWREARVSWSIAPLIEPRAMLARRLALFAGAVAFVLVMPWLGFTASVFLFLMAMLTMLAGPANWRTALAISVAVAALAYGVFILLIGLRFPAGPIEGLIAALLRSAG